MDSFSVNFENTFGALRVRYQCLQNVSKHLIKHIMDCISIENSFITPAKLLEKIFKDFPTIEMGKYFRNCITKTFTCPCGCVQTFQKFLCVTKIIKRDESFLKSIAKHYEPQGDSEFCPNCVGLVIGSSITRFNITSKFWVVSSNEEVEFSRIFSCSNGYKYKLIAIISEKILQENVLYSLVYYNERTSVYKVFADVRCYEVENDIFEKRKGSRTAIYELEERPEEPDIYKYLRMEEFVSNTDKGYYEFCYTRG